MVSRRKTQSIVRAVLVSRSVAAQYKNQLFELMNSTTSDQKFDSKHIHRSLSHLPNLTLLSTHMTAYISGTFRIPFHFSLWVHRHSLEIQSSFAMNNLDIA